MNLVERLKKQTAASKTAIMLYAAPGLGKTSLAAEFPKCYFIPDGFDRGIQDLVENNQVPEAVKDRVFEPLRDYKHLKDTCEWLATEKGLEKDVNWVCFDGLSGIEEHIWDHWIAERYQGNRDKFLDFFKGPSSAKEAFREFTRLLDRIRERGIGVILLAHAGTKNSKNALGDDYAKIVPLCDARTFEVFQQWVPNLGYIEQVVTTSDEGNTTKAAKADIRQIRFTPIPACEAKNRWGISQPVPMGRGPKEAFYNLMEEVKKSIAKPKTEAA